MQEMSTTCSSSNISLINKEFKYYSLFLARQTLGGFVRNHSGLYPVRCIFTCCYIFGVSSLPVIFIWLDDSPNHDGKIKMYLLVITGMYWSPCVLLVDQVNKNVNSLVHCSLPVHITQHMQAMNGYNHLRQVKPCNILLQDIIILA